MTWYETAMLAMETYWDKKNKLPFEFMNNYLRLFAFSCPSVSLALQHGGLYHVNY